MPRVSLPPLGVWSVEANTTRLAAMESSLPSILSSLSAASTHHFRRDLLAFYKATELIPHPQLLPYHPDEEDPSSNPDLAASAVAYDLVEIDTLTIKNWQLDDGSFQGLCFALQHCPKIHTVIFFNVQLRAEQSDQLCRLLPQTQVTRFHLEWNAPSSPPSPSALAELLTPSSNITTLSLRSCGLAEDHAVAIGQALRDPNSKLELLNLFDNAIGDAGALEIAYALPLQSCLKSLSLGNVQLSGKAAKILVDVVSPKYVAPPSLLKVLEDAEPRIQAEIDAAKKAKKKLDRQAAIQILGLPVLETVDGVQYAHGNTTLQDLVLSGNEQIEDSDVLAIHDVLETHGAVMETYLKRIKLQRIPVVKALTSSGKIRCGILQF